MCDSASRSGGVIDRELPLTPLASDWPIRTLSRHGTLSENQSHEAEGGGESSIHRGAPFRAHGCSLICRLMRALTGPPPPTLHLERSRFPAGPVERRVSDVTYH